MVSEQTYHGWYSEKAKEMGGSSVYLNPAGQEVEVTAVADTLAWADEYLWEDKRYVGPVTTHVRKLGHGVLGPPAFFYPPPADRVAYNLAFGGQPKVVAPWPDEFVPRKGILTRYGRKLKEQADAAYGKPDDGSVK